ncbi:S-layer homology domain-containing protein [Filifactor alocis]
MYVDEKERAFRIDPSAYDVNSGSVIFATNHLSVYGVGYTAPSQRFDDTKKHWAKDFIDYVVGRGLLDGSRENKFYPNEKMTRGMLVTALGKLAGVNVKKYETNSFTDVQNDSSYHPYIEWAYSKGVVYGIGDGTFAPDKSITREEMAVIFERYAKVMGCKIPVTREASVYEDKEQIGTEYGESVKAMQQAGIMMGIDGNKFNPKGNATRAEVSAMLSRYIKLTIIPETAQGFVLDDAGKYHYYKDGKALTGKQTLDGTVYFFDESGVLQIGWVKDGNIWRYYDGTKAHKGWLNLKVEGEERIYYLNREGLLESGKWVKIDGKWYYFYPDGTLAVNTEIDGYKVDGKGVRKEK